MRIYKINLLTFFVIQSRLKTIDLTKVINKINKTRLCIKNSYISRKKNGVDKKAIAQQWFSAIAENSGITSSHRKNKLI